MKILNQKDLIEILPFGKTKAVNIFLEVNA